MPGDDRAAQSGRRRLAVVLMAGLTTGCATTPTQWYLNGRSEAEFRGHDSRCAAQADEVTSGQNMKTAGQFMGTGGQVAGLGLLLAALEVGGVSARHSACLQGLGYTRAP